MEAKCRSCKYRRIACMSLNLCPECEAEGVVSRLFENRCPSCGWSMHPLTDKIAEINLMKHLEAEAR